jgi:pectinesterase
VQIDPTVFNLASGPFDALTTDAAWRFKTKPAPPSSSATRIVVAADGSGDFNTIQGAVDFLPDNPPQRVTIFIRNGNYEEIVFFRKKANLTFRGEDREKVQVGYGNNSAFNPPMPGPSRRCAFSVYDSTGIELVNFSLSNYAFGQAEALLVFGSKNIVSNMNLKGSGDALNLRGSVYLADSTITGDGDTILGVGPAFFRHCVIRSVGAFMWIRNTEANHGNVFVDCTFTGIDRSPTAPLRPTRVLARLPNNHGLNYPYAEAVLINCRLSGIAPAGWGPVDGETDHIHFWEFKLIVGARI